MDSDIFKLNSKPRILKDTKIIIHKQTNKQQDHLHLKAKNKVMQLNKPREGYQAKFQPSFVGIIYEEMSILDTFDDCCIMDIPLLFEKMVNDVKVNALSDMALSLQPKIRNVTSRVDMCEKFSKPSSQNLSRKKQRTTKEGSNVFLNSMKLSGLLGSSIPAKNLMRIESLTRSSKHNGKVGGRLARLLFERQSCQNSVMKLPLPSIKASPQPEKNMLRTSYLQLWNFNPNHKESHKVRSSSGTVSKQRRPKSGEKAINVLKNVYNHSKQKLIIQ